MHAQGASCYLTRLSPEQAADAGIRHPNGRTLVSDRRQSRHKTVLNTLEISCNGFRAPKANQFDNISWYGPEKLLHPFATRASSTIILLKDGLRAHVGM